VKVADFHDFAFKLYKLCDYDYNLESTITSLPTHFCGEASSSNVVVQC